MKAALFAGSVLALFTPTPDFATVSRPIPVSPSPLLCTVGDMTEDLQRRRAELVAMLGRAALGASGTPHGLRVKFDDDQETLAAVLEWISIERACCPFLSFNLLWRPDGGAVELDLVGPSGTAAFLEPFHSHLDGLESSAQPAGEVSRIEAAVRRYVEVLHKPNPDRFQDALAPMFSYVEMSPGQGLVSLSREELADLAADKSADQLQRDTELKSDIEVLSATGSVATATVRAAWGWDFVQLARAGDAWKVVHVLRQPHDA